MKRETGEKVFGSWSVKELLGKGAFGRVYRIEREEFGTVYQAAMKKIVIPQTDEEIEDAISEGMDEESVTSYFKGFVEEIVNEFNLMSKLKGHTNIVNYEDHQVIPHEDGIGWDILIRMELLKSLKTLTAERNLTEEEVIKLGIDICNALEVCGKLDIIHRDIKPENIFISNFGEFKLGDFGIARTAEKTMSNLSKKGTYTYMAPEVYKGEGYDATVDIYSLGIVMYRFMNYNRAPFLPAYPEPISFSDREASLTRRISEEPMPAPACGSRELKQVILKACAYRPSARYQSPVQLRNDLEKLLKDTDAVQEKAAPVAVPAMSAAPEEMLEEETMTVSAVPEVIPEEETVTVSAAPETETGQEEPAPRRGLREWDDTLGEEESTVSMFGAVPQPGATKEEPAARAKAPAGQQTEPAPLPKKKKTGLLIGLGIVVAVVAAAIFFVFTRGGSAAPPSDNFEGFSYLEEMEEEGDVAEEEASPVETEETAETVETVEIVPLSNQYLYGHYTIGDDGSADQAFLESVGMMEISGEEVSAIPCEIYCFPEGTLYRTFMFSELVDEIGGGVTVASSLSMQASLIWKIRR